MNNLEQQVLAYEERSFTFDENEGILDEQLQDRITAPNKVLSGIVRLNSGEGYMDVPVFGVSPIKKYAQVLPRTSIAVGSQVQLQGTFARRAVTFTVWNYDTTNGLFLDINSGDGGLSGFYLAPNTFFGDDLSMTRDVTVTLRNPNTNTGAVLAQIYLAGY